MMRATPSTFPPGANPTTIEIGRVGHACASAAALAAHARPRNSILKSLVIIGRS
jgi:hypothetical protein